MAYTKHGAKIENMEEFLTAIKEYLLSSGKFRIPVNLATLPKTKPQENYTGFSVLHIDGKRFNFGKRIGSPSFVENQLTVSISRDDIPSRFFYNNSDELMLRTYPATTRCGKYQFPLVNLYVTTTKSFVAFSAEVRKGVFIHLIVGKHYSYDGDDGEIGGEFVYTTFMPDGTNIRDDTEYIGANTYRMGKITPAYRYMGQTSDRQSIMRSNRYNKARAALYDGIPFRYWDREAALPSRVMYYGLACPINNPLRDEPLEMFDIQHINIIYGSSRYNHRSVMNPHHLKLSVDKSSDAAGKVGSANVRHVQKDAEVFYNNEMCTMAIEDIEPATIRGDWIIFPVVSKSRDGMFRYLWSSNIGIGFKFK